MKKLVAAALASVSLVTLAAPAQAAQFVGVYTATNATSPLSALFNITTSDILNPFGYYDILSVTGVIAGNSITGLVPTSAGQGPGSGAPYGFPNAVLSNSGNFVYDNFLSTTAPYVTAPGFLVNASDGLEYNLFFDSGTSYQLMFGSPGGGGTGGSIGTFALTPVVPEPATWALTIVGFGLLGGALRRRRQVVRVRYT